MKEATRIALVDLCAAYVANPDSQENLQALFDRAPRGVYYVRNAKGVPLYRMDVPYAKETGEKTGEIACVKADAEDKKNRPAKH